MGRKEKVTKVIDGDTIETSRRKKPVRLANVSAPDKGKPGYNESKKFLEEELKGEQVRIKTKARDPWGRAVATVYKGKRSVNKQMSEFLKKHKWNS
ncbi:MAG: thermonuclease family protein [Candidatus Lokiarchaeia archaeon]